MPVQRRLAAILAADVVGYSRLMEADEEGTRARLKGLHLELIDPRISADGGRIVKTMGDGFLVEFPSAVNAVRNALSIQSAMWRRNGDIPDEIRIEVRIGVNVGDVIVEGDDIHGDGVNVAARLEGLCEPGEVYVSGTVFDQADGKLAATFEDLGTHPVKNITKPVRVYRVRDEAKKHAGSQSNLGSAPSISDKPSIAVLPFDNLSDDRQQEYFSDGMAEDLITDIAQISGVSVVARNSSFAFKGEPLNVKEIARTLGVNHIVEGSVRKMGDRLRINAQLIDCNDGRHIWAARYDGNLAEIFEFQDDIRAQIVSALQVNLTPSDKALVERKSTESVAAYDLFLKGRANIYHYTQQHMREAIKCLEEAVELDPNFGDAYGYLSFCHFYGWALMWPDFDDNLDRTLKLAERGVELDGESAIAVMRLGWAQAWLRRYDPAIANFEKAISLAPENAEVYASFGQVLNYLGDPNRGLEMLEKAFNLESFAPPVWEWQIGHSHLLLRHYDEALARIHRAIERAPKMMPAYVGLTCAHIEMDRLDDARAALKQVLEIAPQFSELDFARIYPYRIDEDRERLLDDLRQAGLPE